MSCSARRDLDLAYLVTKKMILAAVTLCSSADVNWYLNLGRHCVVICDNFVQLQRNKDSLAPLRFLSNLIPFRLEGPKFNLNALLTSASIAVHKAHLNTVTSLLHTRTLYHTTA
jgi:hypothetical protein